MKIREPEMVKLSKNEKHMSLWKQILKFIGVYIGLTIVTIIVTLILGILLGIVSGIVIAIISNNTMGSSDLISKFTNLILSPRAESFITLYGTIVTLIITILYCKFLEKKSLRSIGFQKKNFFKHYLIGLLIGGFMIFIAILINFLVGSIKIEGISEGFNGTTLFLIIAYFIGFVFQGASEEILFRGFFMIDIGAKHKIITAIIVSSLIFSLAHVFNPGITIFELISLFLLGVFLSLYIICFDNIWGACAIHTMWNFIQVNIFGINTDLLKISDSIFKTTEIASTLSLHIIDELTGIAFFVIAICLLLLYMKKHGKFTLSKFSSNENDQNVTTK